MAFFGMRQQVRPTRLMHKINWDETSGADHPANLEEGWMMLKTAGNNPLYNTQGQSLVDLLEAGLSQEYAALISEESMLKGIEGYVWDEVPVKVQKAAAKLYEFVKAKGGISPSSDEDEEDDPDVPAPDGSTINGAPSSATGVATPLFQGGVPTAVQQGTVGDRDYHNGVAFPMPKAPNDQDLASGPRFALRKATFDGSNPPGGLINDKGTSQNIKATAKVIARALAASRMIQNVQSPTPINGQFGAVQGNDPAGGQSGFLAGPNSPAGYSQNDPVAKVAARKPAATDDDDDDEDDKQMAKAIVHQWPGFISHIEGVMGSELSTDLKKAAILAGYADFVGAVTQEFGLRQWDRGFVEPLQKTFYSTADRKKMAGKGQAKSDGSYPINSPIDVRNAVKDYGRSNGSSSDMAHIKARARAIGATNMLPDSWK